MPIISGQGGAGGIVADQLPWIVDVFGTAPQSAHVGTWGLTQVSSRDYAFIFSNSTLAQNDSTSWDVVLSAGTWTLRTVADTSTNLGISTITLGAVAVGTQDWFSGSTVSSVVKDNAGIVIPSTTKYRLTYLMATKNAGSTNFGFNFTAAHLVRTA